MARVLFLSKDASLAALLATGGHDVVRSAEEGHDLVVSDVPMPGNARPVIVCTEPGDVAARIRALELGADDVFDAGFAPSQMVARVGAVARRAAPERIVADGCTVDLAAHTASRHGKSVDLTAREVDIIRWLYQHKNRIVSRTELLEHVWGVSPDNTTRAVDVAVSALRAKLEHDPRSPTIIRSKKGAGYRWCA
jgi:two-component system alkaline phosphatase synthesis response regulator PhoP